MSSKSESRSPQLDHYLTPLRRLAGVSQDGLDWLCEALATAPTAFPAGAIDRLDERLARARREAFGRRNWLLSWHRAPDGSWRARLSGPDSDRTIERSARTRACAILLSARAMSRIRAFRARIGTPPGPDPDSRFAARH